MNRQVDSLLDAMAHQPRRPPVDAERPDGSFLARLRMALGHVPYGDDSWSPAPARQLLVPVHRSVAPRRTAAAVVAGVVVGLSIAVVGKVEDAGGPVSSDDIPTPSATQAAGSIVELARETPRAGTGYVLLPGADAIRMECGRTRTARITYALPVRRSALSATLSADGPGGSAAVDFSVGAGQERRSFPVAPGRPADPVVYEARGPADSIDVVVRCTGGVTSVTLAGPTLVS